MKLGHGDVDTLPEQPITLPGRTPRLIGKLHYSAVIFPVSITVFQRAISSARNLANCSPLLATTSNPTASNFALTSGEVADATNSASSRALTAAGSPLGSAPACPE